MLGIELERFAPDASQQLVTEREGFLRSGNNAGKSHVGAFIGVCIARGVRRVDGRTLREAYVDGVEPWYIELPFIPTPNLGFILCDTLKQGEDSVVAAYKKLIGDHDHKFQMSSDGTGTIWVRPDRMPAGGHYTSWSKISVYSNKGAIPRGPRILWAHGDECPTQGLWDEIRFRRTPGLAMYRVLTVTPIEQEEWEWLREDYEERPAPWKFEIVMPMAHNQALSAADRAIISAEAESSPWMLARLFGEYVSLDGKNPFLQEWEELMAWGERTIDAREDKIMSPREVYVDDERGMGSRIEKEEGVLYVWRDPVPGERYFAIGDTSPGTADGFHDPCGLHVVAQGVRNNNRPYIAVRYNGYIGGYGLGHLLAYVGERYNDAPVDFDNTGSGGLPVLRGLNDYRSRKHRHGYNRLVRSQKLDARGRPFSSSFGVTVTEGIKSDFLEYIRHALKLNLIDCWSAGIVRCLREARTDENGRLIKVGKIHYEDLHCLGRALQLVLGPVAQLRERRERNVAEKILSEHLGRPIRLPVQRSSRYRSTPWRRRRRAAA